MSKHEMPKQWTYVYWEATFYRVYHQVPDPTNPEYRCISDEIHRGTLNIPWQDMPRPGDPHCDYDGEYAAKQIELGLPYATAEYPLRTCQGKIINQ